jgi:hypothetical protein
VGGRVPGTKLQANAGRGLWLGAVSAVAAVGAHRPGMGFPVRRWPWCHGQDEDGTCEASLDSGTPSSSPFPIREPFLVCLGRPARLAR